MAPVHGSVVEVSDVGPRMRRVVFDVPQLAELNLPGAADEVLGIYFSDGTEGRNYSVRRRGPGENQITCDFVVHGRGLASDWARRTTVGDRVGLDHARSWYLPGPATDWQLLVADLSGLPALARILEELPEDTDVSVIVEVPDAAHLDYLPARSDFPIVTTMDTGNGCASSRLGELVRSHPHPDGRGYCWFAGEAGSTREVRRHLRGDRGWDSDQYDVVGYWRFDSETWDRRYEAVSAEMFAVYERALAEGKGAKLAAEEYDEALERIGL
ncbi:siderophore-interacting protein [Mycolicibacterium hodleri]|uniref:Siderophore-interacting protein n=1 Tax=Mycolicibacterium hodleri TaxID=49897 RepID=A0A502DLL8_9MYCO|nr:siderophore-interacting protein [Mycolicibacterium hodleri]TPG25550.1 siderophore-interacting protein [Mycolicibacterium hodleri]